MDVTKLNCLKKWTFFAIQLFHVLTLVRAILYDQGIQIVNKTKKVQKSWENWDDGS